MLLGVNYLHANNVIHRDLKLSNVFMSDKGEIKIGDFGVSIIANHETLSADTTRVTHDLQVGTPIYLAPELVKRKSYDYKVDIWALGVIMHYLATHYPPFSGSNSVELYDHILMNKPKELPKNYTTRFRRLVNSFLSK